MTQLEGHGSEFFLLTQMKLHNMKELGMSSGKAEEKAKTDLEAARTRMMQAKLDLDNSVQEGKNG